jgi:hypothetical protein
MKQKIILLLSLTVSLAVFLLWRYNFSDKFGDLYGLNDGISHFFFIVALCSAIVLFFSRKNFSACAGIASGFAVNILLRFDNFWWLEILMIAAGAGLCLLLFKKIKLF